MLLIAATTGKKESNKKLYEYYLFSFSPIHPVFLRLQENMKRSELKNIEEKDLKLNTRTFNLEKLQLTQK